MLSEQEKTWVVRRFAQFATAHEIASEALARGIETNPLEIAGFDPARYHVGPALVAVFQAVRKEFIESPFAAPTMSRKIRIIELNRMFNEAKQIGRNAQAAALLDQIREEMNGLPDPDAGGANGQPSGPVQTIALHVTDPPTLPPEYMP